jgi:predicted CoA-substrate-specific enzyme activase
MSTGMTKSRSSANRERAVEHASLFGERGFLVGIDVGSTTVKAVVCKEPGGKVLFHDYRRHEGRQADTVLDVLHRAKGQLSLAEDSMRLFMTGSGGQQLAKMLGARFVQEVAAVSLAVERAYPEVRSVIELGGQDAKMILFQDGGVEGRRKKIATMNDKCAGGTGVIIEKIAAKLHVSREDLLTQTYENAQIYPIAGKCGVFAETDITGLQKHGVPNQDLIASLFHAIVLQNLSVLTRGSTLMPTVFLLGGPNAFYPGLQAAWRRGLVELWKRKNTSLPHAVGVETLVTVPPMAEYFAAIGAIEFGASEPESGLRYQGERPLEVFVRENERSSDVSGIPGGLFADTAELDRFRAIYARVLTVTPALPATPAEVFIGLDGGSTSTKAVAISPRGDVVCASYRLSQFDPITDALTVLRDLRAQLERNKEPLHVLGLGTTGYSKDLLKRVLSADVALVETVAHAKSSLRLFPDVDAIIDVGGQDIKIIVLQDGTVKDFKLNTQCSAGNGYFLQAAAEGLGIRVEDFADTAFRATRMPEFSYGCAVFLQSDIVNFQRLGWRPEEILAGLATVLPKNVFLYVAGVSNVAGLGRRIVLQGGTQKNLAVVKAELDFIQGHYHGDGLPEVKIHPNCCEAGAIGAALEAMERYRTTQRTVFPGFASLDKIQYAIRRDETTRCRYCSNRCLRTLVQLRTDDSGELAKNVMIANCPRGEAETADDVRRINAQWSRLRENSPNYVQIAAEQAWQPTHPPLAMPTRRHLVFGSHLADKTRLRAGIHIGIPRALNLFTYAPLFSAFFESLGVLPEHLHYSHFSSPKRYQQAAGFSAIDPCFPSKVAVAHVYELLQHCKKQPLDAIFFPMFDVLTSPLTHCSGSNACPSGAATPEAVKAAFSRTVDWFQQRNVRYLNPVIDLSDRDLFKFQMYSCWKQILDLDWDENSRAVDIAFCEWQNFEAGLHRQARQTLDDLELDGRIGLVMLGRPYHHDPGLNQGILEELQKLGYPIFSQSLLPQDADLLNRLFGSQLQSEAIRGPLDISDVWKQSFSASSNHKLWAAKFVARHPNLISVELSNFKCGHDAFISRTIEEIIERSGKPHFSFRDLDENRPLASIRIRVETIHYFLEHYQETLKHCSRGLSRSIAETNAYLAAHQPANRDLRWPSVIEPVGKEL